MKRLSIAIIILVIIYSSCTKDDNQITLSSAADFYNYCSTKNNNSCGELLNHEGQYISMIGYVNANNVKRFYNFFTLFDSPSVDFNNGLNVGVNNDSTAIFNKLISNLDTVHILNFTKIKVIGRIGGSNVLYVNEGCKRLPEFSVDNSKDIFITGK